MQHQLWALTAYTWILFFEMGDKWMEFTVSEIFQASEIVSKISVLFQSQLNCNSQISYYNSFKMFFNIIYMYIHVCFN